MIKSDSIPGFVIVLACCLGLYGFASGFDVFSSFQRDPGMDASQNAEASDVIGAPFQLIDQTGQKRDQSILKGHWTAVFFGYASCPDICPATLQVLNLAQNKLKNTGPDLQIVFVTLDPENDTPEVLQRFLHQEGFPQSVLALTGSKEAVANMAKAYRVFYQKEQLDRAAGPKSPQSQNFGLAHSAMIYLMDPQERFAGPLSYEKGPDKMAEDIKTFIKQTQNKQS